ncbi:hypothetical protein AIOL_003423 [Candidatus Rhodobacter oscarellae]|uniref:SH3 domain-containing protein n=1 Tax=Candidatus Rhodobacter oscarellae TaxID=1675527 RepID=A0A0J9GY97_9RHOB|nr:SH3 domain-containing protein [Candidatus Rhodobacter lobularis]KMW58448.1 hypothetical protein AIOL_003423 [Candidatus Rhodobacter lobularis]
MAPSTRKVIRAWARTYDPALAVEAGARVEVTHEDDQWPGWWWCIDAGGQGGWLPADLISPAQPGRSVILRAMDTRELTVIAGECVRAYQSERGWTMCENDLGARGWVPDEALAPPPSRAGAGTD